MKRCGSSAGLKHSFANSRMHVAKRKHAVITQEKNRTSQSNTLRHNHGSHYATHFPGKLKHMLLHRTLNLTNSHRNRQDLTFLSPVELNLPFKENDRYFCIVFLSFLFLFLKKVRSALKLNQFGTLAVLLITFQHIFNKYTFYVE